MMKLLNIIFLLFVSLPVLSKTKDEELKKFYSDNWKLTDRSIEYLYAGEILADSTVTSEEKSQTFKLKAAALHPKACKRVLRKLSMLEKYQDWIGFVKKSTYDEKNRLFTIRADHTLLPYPMIVHIIVERPTKAGSYPFVFPTGMFTGLRGEFIIKKHKGRCAFYAKSYWKGKATKLPNFFIELFSETLTKIGGELLFRKIK